MEAFGIIGMSFGISGLTFGLIAWTATQKVAKELAELKEALRQSGALAGKP